jgi:dienelactone hydrolase
MRIHLPAGLAALLALATAAFAEIKTATVAYKEGDTELEGFVAYDDSLKGPRPGVLVVHDWSGLQDYAKSRAKQIAELGYVAFAADIYGKGIRPTDPKERSALAGKYKSDLPLLRKRLLAALEQLKAQPGVDAKKLGAIGYCFGGTSALELARAGADVQGVVSFHGGLGTTIPAKPGTLVASVLVCHGADDPYVKPEEVAAFKKEMEQAKAKLTFIAYPGAVHSFTNPTAGNDVSKGNAYQEKADKESWTAMKKFFADSFGK